VAAPVHIVPQEQVVCHRTGSAHAEELEQVLELAFHTFSKVSALVYLHTKATIQRTFEQCRPWMSPTTVTGEEILETFGASWRRGTGRAGGAERSVMVRHREARGLAGSIGAARDVRMKRGRGRAGQHHKDLLQAFAQLHHLLLLQNLHVAASLDTLVQVQHRPPPAANLPNPPAPSLLNQRTTLMFASFSTLTTLPSSPSSVGLQRFSRSRSLARPRARSRTPCPCTVARAPGRSLELVFVTRRLRG
jgi:hypothetical protein